MEKFTSIGRNMIITTKYFKIFIRDELSQYGINAAEGIILLMMYRKSELFDEQQHNIFYSRTQDELIREIHYDKSGMTRAMKNLEENGFVERNKNPADSRSYLFSLTTKGKEFRSILIGILKKWNDKLLCGINDEELKTIEKALAIMSENASTFYLECYLPNNNK